MNNLEQVNRQMDGYNEATYQQTKERINMNTGMNA